MQRRAPVTGLDGIESEEFTIVNDADLTDKQRMFVHGYMRHRNIRQAAIDAGYGKAGTADPARAGQLLMQKPTVRGIIQILLNNRIRRIQATPSRIEEELAKIAFSSIGRFVVVQADGSMYHDFSRADDADLAGLKSFKCEIVHEPGEPGDAPKQVRKMEVQAGDKLGALMGLARIHKMIGGEEGPALLDIAEAIREGRKRAGIE